MNERATTPQGRRLAPLLLMLAVVAAYLAQAVPPVVTYQGSVQGVGRGAVPDGLYQMQFSIFDAEMGGTSVWTETDPSVPVTGGLFSTTLGDATPFGSLFASSSALGLEVAIDLKKQTAEETES
jgi:hypothetical protein